MLNASADDLDSNIWTNPVDGRASSATIAAATTTTTTAGVVGTMHDGRVSSNENRIPDTIQRELDHRRIGNRCEWFCFY